MESGKLLLKSHRLGLNKISSLTSYMSWSVCLISVTISFVHFYFEKLLNQYNYTFYALEWLKIMPVK